MEPVYVYTEKDADLCPYCEALHRAQKKPAMMQEETESGVQYAVQCLRCGLTGPRAKRMDYARNKWQWLVACVK